MCTRQKIIYKELLDAGCRVYKICLKKDRTFVIQFLLLYLQHYKLMPPSKYSPLLCNGPNVSSTAHMLREIIFVLLLEGYCT